jgi:ABC-type branched-subunit amino acid transport system substrate-binding protein
VALNQQVKDLIQKLGEAIHESVSDSEQISGVVREIREQGFDVLLMLEATIGLNEVEDAAAEGGEEGHLAPPAPSPATTSPSCAPCASPPKSTRATGGGDQRLTPWSAVGKKRKNSCSIYPQTALQGVFCIAAEYAFPEVVGP